MRATYMQHDMLEFAYRHISAARLKAAYPPTSAEPAASRFLGLPSPLLALASCMRGV